MCEEHKNPFLACRFSFCIFSAKGCNSPLIIILAVLSCLGLQDCVIHPGESWYQAQCGFLLHLFPSLSPGLALRAAELLASPFPGLSQNWDNRIFLFQLHDLGYGPSSPNPLLLIWLIRKNWFFILSRKVHSGSLSTIQSFIVRTLNLASALCLASVISSLPIWWLLSLTLEF